MTVIHHTLSLPLGSWALPTDVGARGWAGHPAERDLVVSLARACREDDRGKGGPAIREAGLLAELVSRPGRRIEGWLALGLGAANTATGCLGLVTLVETAAGWSIGWLVVHPLHRRRGLARGLVSIAAAAARARGAETIAAETLARWPAASAFWRGLASREPHPGLD